MLWQGIYKLTLTEQSEEYLLNDSSIGGRLNYLKFA